MLLATKASAADELKILSCQIDAKQTDAYIELYLSNESFDVANLQFDILLPEGMEFSAAGVFTERVPSTTESQVTNYDFAYQTNVLDDGYTRFMFIPKGKLRKIAKGEGTILRLPVTADVAMVSGAHSILMKNIKLVASVTSATSLSDVSTQVTISGTSVLRGDANGDKKVTITDAVSIVNCILGNPSGDFNTKAADVNGDGKITITDAVGVVNIILKGDNN